VIIATFLMAEQYVTIKTSPGGIVNPMTTNKVMYCNDNIIIQAFANQDYKFQH